VLRGRGSAVDAVLAAAFAGAVCEPALTSLGGGGFCLHAAPGQEPEILDFFVDVPGIGGPPGTPHVETVVIDFAKAGPAAAASEQVFHGGWGTVAVPGCFSGYLDAHRRWGRLPLADVVRPAVGLAREGAVLSVIQLRFLTLVGDLLAITPDSRELFAGAGRTGVLRNPGYADLLLALGRGEVSGAWDPAFSAPLLAASRAGGGLLTDGDIAAYRPHLRTPLAVTHRGAEAWTNPAPSVGGSIVLDALARLPQGEWVRWATVAEALADATLHRRGPGQVSTGTTHVSVIDAQGGIAALTTSNGSGSGTLVPGWGVTLNNMLGEEDLHPGDPAQLVPGTRMGSMMAPTLVQMADGSRVVLGTGGSERIRSALLGVLVRLIDDASCLADAVAAPRMHTNGIGPIHVEPGFTDANLADLSALAAGREWPGLEPWPDANVFFGGVHAVRRAADGSVEAVGDARRSGASAVVLADGTVLSA
jgi:gamma-glutamyltranspeptidase/glutathione hydrolase